MFESIIAYFESINPIWAALASGLFTWAMTAIGAALVFVFKNPSKKLLDGMLGFTGGVMIAASFWSLLAPAIKMSSGEGFVKVMPAAVGFALGALFLFGLDKLLPHLHLNHDVSQAEGVKTKTPWQKTTLLVLAITLHNIPEGLAVGILFGGFAAGVPEATIAGALILTLGIGLQNLPEGLAVSFPLRRAGMSKSKSFIYGQSSALVEPVSAVIGALAVGFFTPALPYALAFAAGAMVFVVIEEVVPETQQGDNSDIATLGFVGGFIIMMMLDVALG